MKFKKTIVEFKISSLEYPFAWSFILNKALSSLGAKFAQKNILGTNFKKVKGPSTLFWVIVKRFS